MARSYRPHSTFTLFDRLFELLGVVGDAKSTQPVRLGCTLLEDRSVPNGLPATVEGSLPGQAPEVRVFDSEGSLIRTFLAFDESLTSGVTASLSDTTGDGVLEVVASVATPSGVQLRVFDGTTGAMLQGFGSKSPESALIGTLADGSVGMIDVPEYAVGGEPGTAPSVKVYGKSGTELRTFFAYESTYKGGFSVTIGDTNADDVPDIIVTPTQSSGLQGRIFDGLSGTLASQFQPTDYFKPVEKPFVPEVFPGRVASYVVGAGVGVSPEVRVFDADGLLVRSFMAFEPEFKKGVRVALADLNLDGSADVVVAPGPGGGPRVRAFDGMSGAVIADFFAYDPSFVGGVNIAAGPIGNGRIGIVTGADAGGGPHVRVFDTDGKIIRDFFAYETNFTGGVRVALGGTASGTPYVYTAPGKGGGPRVRSFDVGSGQVQVDRMVYDSAFAGGLSLSAADLDGDGTAEVITSPGAGGGSHVRALDGITGQDVDTFFSGDPNDLGGTSSRIVSLPDQSSAIASLLDNDGSPWLRVLGRSETDDALYERSTIGPFPGLGKGISFSAWSDTGAYQLNTLADEPVIDDLPELKIVAYDPTANEIYRETNPLSTTGLFQIVRTGDVTKSLDIKAVLSGTARYNLNNDKSARTDPDYRSDQLEASLAVTGNVADVLLSFDAGARSTWVKIEALDDELIESKETVILELAESFDIDDQPLYQINSGYKSAEISIIDNEPISVSPVGGKQQIWIDSIYDNTAYETSAYTSSTVTFGNGDSAYITINRSDIDGPLDVEFTYSGSAVPWYSGTNVGTDYKFFWTKIGDDRGIVHFPDQESNVKLYITPSWGDGFESTDTNWDPWPADHEGIETVNVTLNTSVNYEILGKSETTFFIYDNDWVAPLPGRYESYVHFSDSAKYNGFSTSYPIDMELDYNNPADRAYVYIHHKVYFYDESELNLTPSFPPAEFPVSLDYFGTAINGQDYIVSDPVKIVDDVNQIIHTVVYQVTIQPTPNPQQNRPEYMDVEVIANSTSWTAIGYGAGQVVATAMGAESKHVSIFNDLTNSMARPVVSVSAPDSVSTEQLQSTGSFKIVMEGAVDPPLLQLELEYDGTAVSADYQILSGDSYYLDNKRYQEYIVRPVDDTEVEETETVILRILPSSDDSYRVDPDAAEATVIILDNDPEAKLPERAFGPMYAPAYRSFEASTEPEFAALLNGRQDASERYGLIAESANRALDNRSEDRVRYADGSIAVATTDLVGASWGESFGLSRVYSNVPEYSENTRFGDGWSDPNRPFLLRNEDESLIILMSNGQTPRYFDKDEETGEYTGRHFIRERLERQGNAFIITTLTGGELQFYDFNGVVPEPQRGQIKAIADEAGNGIRFDYDSKGLLQSMERGSGSTIERIEYQYAERRTDDFRVSQARYQRKNGTNWDTIRSVDYVYYTKGETNGRPVDLKYAIVRDAEGRELEREYYRYKLVANKPSLLESKFGTESYRRLISNVGDPTSLSDQRVEIYADETFRYDTDRRITEHVVAGLGSSSSGGQGKYTFSYSSSSHDPDSGMNVWITKTTVTLPDNTTQTVYANKLGEVMLSIVTLGEQQWKTAHVYDDDGRRTLTAFPTAVTGHDESLPDLIGLSGGNYLHLADTTGLIQSLDWYSTDSFTTTTPGGAKGWFQGSALRHGEIGSSPVPQNQIQYSVRTSTPNRFDPAIVSTYRGDDGSGEIEDHYDYSFSGMHAESMSQTRSTGNSRDSITTTALTRWDYDGFGRVIGITDPAGIGTQREYEDVTGALESEIRDVAGIQHSTSWSVDIIGRPLKQTIGSGDQARVDYFTYDDIRRETRHYQGWVQATTPSESYSTGLTLVTRLDASGYYSETMSMAAVPTLTSSGTPTGHETVNNVQSLNRKYVNRGNQVVFDDSYSAIGAGEYVTGLAPISSANSKSLRTASAYDQRGRLYATLTPDNVERQTQHDGLGRVTSTWTHATPVAPENWTPTNTSALIQLTGNIYDNDGVGNGNLTQTSVFPGSGLAARVTSVAYDWRNRPVFFKQGDEDTESTALNRPVTYKTYDNLNHVLTSEVFDGDAIEATDTDSNEVPDSLTTSTRKPYSRETNDYDDRGLLVRTSVVNFTHIGTATPTAGAPATTDTWYDGRGLPIAVLSPTGQMEKTKYDGLGRVEKVSLVKSIVNGEMSFHVLFGDSTGDGAVDATEMALFTGAFGATGPGGRYNVAFDYNGDNYIDGSTDLAFFGMNMNKSVDVGSQHPLLTVGNGSSQRSRIKTWTLDLNGTMTKAGDVVLVRRDPVSQAVTGEVKAAFTSTNAGKSLAINLTGATTKFSTEIVNGYLADGLWTMNLSGFEVDGKTPNFTDVASTAFDTVLREDLRTYDPRGNVIQSVTKERFDGVAGAGPLGNSTTGIKARVTYSDQYFDKADRLTHSVSLGKRDSAPLPVTPPNLAKSQEDKTPLTTTAYSYQAEGLHVTVTDPFGTKGKTIYDLLGRETESRRGDDVNPVYVTTRQYNPSTGQLVQIKEPGDIITKFSYDDLGRLHDTTARFGTKAETIATTLYNTIGEVTQSIEPYMSPAAAILNSSLPPLVLRSAATFRDVVGRVTKLVDGYNTSEARTTETSYNPLGAPLSVKDSRENTTTFTYTETSGTLITAKNAENVSQYTKSDLGGRVTMTGTGSFQTFTSYDLLNRISQSQTMLGAKTKYRYFVDGNETHIVDPLLQVTKHTVDDQGRPYQTIDALNIVRSTTTYDFDARIVRVTDENNVVDITTFDNLGRQTKVHENDNTSNPRTTAYDYSSKFDVLTSVIDPNGNETQYNLDDYGRIQSVDLPDDVTIEYTYDSLDRVKTKAQSRVTTTYDYTFFGMPQQIAETGKDYNSNEVTRTTKYQYDKNDNPIEVEDVLGRVTTFGFDKANRMTSETRPMDSTQTVTIGYTYDARNFLTRVSRPGVDLASKALSVTKYAYDNAGRNTYLTNPVGESTTLDYDGADQLISVSNAYEETTTYEYDANGRPTLVTDPRGYETKYTYVDTITGLTYSADDPGNAMTLVSSVKVKDARNNETITYQDEYGRDALTVNSMGYHTAMRYDDNGNLRYRTQVESESVQKWDYDNRDRVSKAYQPYEMGSSPVYYQQFDYLQGFLATRTDELSKVTTYGYDEFNRQNKVYKPSGLWTTVFDNAGRVTQQQNELTPPTKYVYGREDLDQPTKVTDAEERDTLYGYDLRGNRILVEDAAGNQTKYTFDLHDRMRSETDPNGKVTTFDYDAADRLTSITDRKGSVRMFGYDAAGNKLTEDWYGKDDFTPYHSQVFEYDEVGNLTSAQDPDGTYTIAYNALNQAIEVEGPFGVVQAFDYDAAGNRNFVNVSNPNDSTSYTIDSSYDPARRISTQTTEVGTSGPELLIEYDYTARGELEYTHRTADGLFPVTTKNVYDDSGRLHETQHVEGTNMFLHMTYYYDVADRMYEQHDYDGTNTTSSVYTYDDSNQLKTLTRTVGGVLTTLLDTTYDSSGNRSNATVEDGNRVTDADLGWTYEFNDLGQMSSKANTSLGESWDYVYDLRGQMTVAEWTDGVTVKTVEYAYDAFGNRIGRTVTDDGLVTSEEHYVLDGWDPSKPAAKGTENFDVVLDLDGDFATVGRRLFGAGFDNVEAWIGADDEVSWYLKDRQQSVRAMVEVDGSGVTTQDYGAFGSVQGTPWGDRYGYQGREWDADLGLLYGRARLLDPDTGRWQSEDPLGQAAGDVNVFRFVGNNPSNGRDPSGLWNPAMGAPIRDYPLGIGNPANPGPQDRLASGALAQDAYYQSAMQEYWQWQKDWINRIHDFKQHSLDLHYMPTDTTRWSHSLNTNVEITPAAFISVPQHDFYQSEVLQPRIRLPLPQPPQRDYEIERVADYYFDHTRDALKTTALGGVESIVVSTGSALEVVTSIPTAASFGHINTTTTFLTQEQRNGAGARFNRFGYSILSGGVILKGTTLLMQSNNIAAGVAGSFAAADQITVGVYALEESTRRIAQDPLNAPAEDYAGLGILVTGMRVSRNNVAAGVDPLSFPTFELAGRKFRNTQNIRTNAALERLDKIINETKDTLRGTPRIIRVVEETKDTLRGTPRLIRVVEETKKNLILEEFKRGGSWLLRDDQFALHIEGKPMVGRSDGQFMISSRRMNLAILKTNGDKALLHEMLGIDKKYPWTQSTDLIRMDVSDPLLFNPRFPNSTMSGANSLFRPGGFTIGGIPEIATDQLPWPQVWVTTFK